MTRFVKGLGALAVLAALVLGAPVLLLRIGRLDALLGFRLADLLAPVQTTDLLLGLMTLVAWLAWFVVVASLVAEVAGVLTSGRVRLRVPGGGWAQPVVSALVVCVAAMAAAPAAHAQAAAPSAPPASASTPSRPSVPAVREHATPGSKEGSQTGVAARGAGAVGHAPVDHSTAAATARHTVQPGDDLWSIAEQYYGDGLQWRRIARDNHLDPSVALPQGRVLLLTDVPTKPTQQPGPAPHHANVMVSAGDTLSGIARDELGDANRWPEIQRANKALVRDADQIDVGWRLAMPQPQARAGSGAGPGTRETDEQHRPASSRAPSATPTGSGPTSHRTEAPGPDVTAAPTTVPRPAPGTVPAGTTTGAGTQGGNTPQTGTPTTVPDEQASDGHATADPALAAAVGLGGLLAAGLGAALVRRRRQQLAQRSMGRRIALPSPEATHFGSTLARVAAEQPEAPDELPPDAVVLGERDGEPVVHRLEDRLTWVHGDGALADSMVAAMATAMTVQPWSADATVVVQGDLPWVASIDEPQVRVVDGLEAALEQLHREVTMRRDALAHLVAQGEATSVQELRADRDRWDAWVPVLLVLSDEAGWQYRDRVLDLLAGDPVGVGVVARAPWPANCDDSAAGGDGPGPGNSCPGVEHHVHVTSDAQARVGDAEPFVPHLLDPSARRALTELFDVAASDETTDAPWWSHDDTLPPNLTVLTRRVSLHTDEEEPVEPPAVHHPTLLLLGPLDLLGCRGTAPTRARRQLVEYCAWIQLNPGRTASMMTRELLVAEGTRRSNLSRLRAWLGEDENGDPYLPDAYSGRIQLHPAVTSDWERLELLVSGGVNRASTDALVDALQLVRGAPLADAAPGQWTWAEALRIDMASTIRDVAGVLADRALAEQDHELARWAAARGLRAAPNDELLLCARLRTEHLAGNRPEVERLVLQVTRGARQLGVDLRDETVVLLQEVMEGRRRVTA